MWRNNRQAARLGLLLFVVLSAGICAVQGVSARDVAGGGTRQAIESKGSSGRRAHVDLRCRIQRDRLHVRLVNNTSQPVVVDKKLVFGLEIVAEDALGKRLPNDETRLVAANCPKGRLESRLVKVRPGASIERVIDLRRPFRVFMTGVSVPDHRISAYEAMRRIRNPGKIHKVTVRYGSCYGFRDGFRQYTGVFPDRVSLCVAKSVAECGKRRPERPNIVILLADDLAWSDVGCYGSTFHETPRLDRLAREGMRFTSGYAAHMSCSPSRAALLTGRCPARLKITAFIPGPRLIGKYLPAKMRMELPFEEVTLAEVLKQHGYATLFVGKWHLGDAPYFPERQGFDVNVGGNRSGAPGGYFWPYGRNKKRTGYHGIEVPGLYEGGRPGEHLCDRLTTEALKLIKAHRDGPFFLYLAYYDVHTPIQAKKDLIEKYRAKARRMGLPPKAPFVSDGTLKRGTRPGLSQNKFRQVQNDPVYAAMVETLDTNVGRLLDGLKRLGLDDKTIVIFTSDNGGYPPITSNLPWRGGKGWAYEGGVREPWLVKWPGVVQPGSRCDVPVIFTDIFPTVLEMAGLPLCPELHCDGVSFVPLLKGESKPIHDALFWHYPHYSAYGCGPYSAIREGDWTLIEWLEDGSVDLFNLAEDPGQRNNLADAMPEKVERLRARLHRWRREVDANMPRPRATKTK